MASIIIKKDSNWKRVEDLIGSVKGDPGAEIRIPNSLKEKGVFGVEGMMLLVLANWVRGNKTKRVVHSYFEFDSDFSGICESLYGIFYTRFSHDFLTLDRKVVDKKYVLKNAYHNVSLVLNGKYNDAFKGGYLPVFSVRAPGYGAASRNPEFNNPFYNNQELISKKQFHKIVKEVIDSIVPQKGRHENLGEKVIEDISEIIRELFSNTHKHARKAADGSLLTENFRAVIFNAVDISRERLGELSESGGVSMASFNVKWAPHRDKKLSVLDITVVDSGPGYARNWGAKNGVEVDSYMQEVDAIISCFEKYKSTDDRESSGSGLDNVLKDLQKVNGWFRLRTGGCIVEKSFLFEDLHEATITKNDFRKANFFTEGVSFNIVIPLRKG